MLQKTLDYYNNSGGNCNAWDYTRHRNQSQWSTPVSTAHQASHWSEAQHPHSHHGHYEHGTREEDCDPSPKIIITSPQPQPPQSSLPPPIPEAELLRLLPPPPSSSSSLPPAPRTIPLNAHLQAYHTIYDKLPIAIYHHMFTIPLLPSISILSSSSTTMPWDFLLRINDHRLTTAILWYNMALLLHLQCLTLVPSVVVSSTTMSRSKLLQQALHSYHQSYYAILMVQPFASSSSSIATAALEQVAMPWFQQQQQQLQQMQYSTLLKSAVCHNLAILYQSEYSNMYMALLLRCQLVHTIQEHHQHHQQQQSQQSQDWLDHSARHVRADPPTTMTMPPHPPMAAGPATTGDGMDVSEYVFFHLGIFFAMINECQLAPAA